MKKTKKMATIFDGHSHIERRIYVSDTGEELVKINGCAFKLWELPKYWKIDIWF